VTGQLVYDNLGLSHRLVAVVQQLDELVVPPAVENGAANGSAESCTVNVLLLDLVLSRANVDLHFKFPSMVSSSHYMRCNLYDYPRMSRTMSISMNTASQIAPQQIPEIMNSKIVMFVLLSELNAVDPGNAVPDVVKYEPP
jgi:hypothetical protein